MPLQRAEQMSRSHLLPRSETDGTPQAVRPVNGAQRFKCHGVQARSADACGCRVEKMVGQIQTPTLDHRQTSGYLKRPRFRHLQGTVRRSARLALFQNTHAALRDLLRKPDAARTPEERREIALQELGVDVLTARDLTPRRRPALLRRASHRRAQDNICRESEFSKLAHTIAPVEHPEPVALHLFEYAAIYGPHEFRRDELFALARRP